MAKWSRFAPAADRRLVKGLLDGDEDALATLYDVYAERLYDYCVALIDDPGDAAGIVHDTFIDAARRTPRMRERERLRAWLYAGVRRRCRRQAQPAAMAEDETFARMEFPLREALYLVHRHDLTGEDLAAALGVSPRRAQARLRRAERQMPDAGEFLGSAAAPTLPSALRHRVLHAGSDPELAGYRAEIAARGGALTPDGMPRQPDAPSRLARRWAFASGLSIATLATAFAALMITKPGLPVPDWPGPSEHQQRTPGRHPHSPSVPPRTGLPGTQPPAAAPVLVPPPHRPGRGPGTLAVKPWSIHFRGGDTAADLRLSAEGGPVSWSATESSPQLALSAGQGRVPAGEHATVHVALRRGLLTLPGTTTVTLSDGTDHSIVITVSWDLSVL
jgi:DNA-directed RNA polymerase specialized sigma24 family protein